MLGEWKTRCGLYAIVDEIKDNKLFGSLLIPGSIIFEELHKPAIPTYWDEKGNSSNPAFDLVQKRRSIEEKW